MVEADTEVRVDKWLWAARFFRTRALAREAVLGGKVHCNGHRVKPGRSLKPGDQLTVSRADEQFDITVVTLTGQRGSATEAREMFREDPASLLRRQALAELPKREREVRLASPGRPRKRERRQIIGFLRDRN